MDALFEMSDVEHLQYDNTSFTNDSNGTTNLDDLLTFTWESRIEAIFYGILFLLAAAGNVPVFFTLTKCRHRKSRIDFMILHLTIADLIVTFLMIPLEISWRITVEWIAGDVACRFMLFIRAFGPYLSSMVLVCISLDRYMAIVHPLKFTDAQHRNRIMLCIAWVFSMLCSIPQSIIFHVESHPVQRSFKQCVSFNFFSAEYQKIAYNLFCLMALYGAPLSVIVFCYSRIMWEIRKRSKATNNGPSYETCPKVNKRLTLRMSDLTQVNRSRSRTLKMTIVIVFTFFFCWTPYVIIDLWYLFDSTSAEALDPRIQSSLFMFAVSNSCVNPLVYGNYIFNFRAFFCSMFHFPPKGRFLMRQSSAVTRVTQVGKPIPNGDLPKVENGYQLTVLGEVHLELRHSTPIRQPLNRRGHFSMEDSSDVASCSRSQCSRCHSSCSGPSYRETVFTVQ